MSSVFDSRLTDMEELTHSHQWHIEQQEKRDLLAKIAREKQKAKRSKKPKPKDEIDRAMTRFARRLDELNTDRERACENCVYYYPDTRYCSVRRINTSPKDRCYNHNFK